MFCYILADVLGEGGGLVALVVLCVSWACYCSVSLPRGAVGLSVVCDRGNVVWSFNLFDLILYVPSTIFHLCRDGSSWFEPVLS